MCQKKRPDWRFLLRKDVETGVFIDQKFGKALLLDRKRLKWIRRDGWGRYIGKDLQECLKGHVLTHELTATYSHEFYRQTEHLYQTVDEKARVALLVDAPNLTKAL